MNTEKNTRRDFMKKAGFGAVAIGVMGKEAISKPSVAQYALPRWRGFNLQYFYTPDHDLTPVEEDFQMISDLGFDFIRLPMSYHTWINYNEDRPISIEDTYNIRESTLARIDQVVEWGEKYGIHIDLNFHHAPGYCINARPKLDPFDLWNDQEGLDAFCFHWGLFAQRYRYIPSSRISFNLINEPTVREDPSDQHSKRSRVPYQIYKKVVAAAAKVIREANPDHIVISDYHFPQLIDLGVAQSCHAYSPGALTHYQASWSGHRDATVPPKWPGEMDGEYWDRKRLEKSYDPYFELARQGIGVHCGELGCYTRTPHNVVLAWFGDVMEMLAENGVGYALWNFRGAFGIMDNNRPDVNYEDWRGHKLDRKLLDLLQKF